MRDPIMGVGLKNPCEHLLVQGDYEEFKVLEPRNQEADTIRVGYLTRDSGTYNGGTELFQIKFPPDSVEDDLWIAIEPGHPSDCALMLHETTAYALMAMPYFR